MSELTFSEQDHKDITEFLNFVFTHAEFKSTPKDMFEFTKLYTKAVNIQKKIESHIMELKAVIDNTKKDKK